MNDHIKNLESQWGVIEETPIRELINQDSFQLSDGNMKKVGGDIHSTVDMNSESSTFGEVHSTLRLPGGSEFHS